MDAVLVGRSGGRQMTVHGSCPFAHRQLDFEAVFWAEKDHPVAALQWPRVNAPGEEIVLRLADLAKMLRLLLFVLFLSATHVQSAETPTGKRIRP